MQGPQVRPDQSAERLAVPAPGGGEQVPGRRPGLSLGGAHPPGGAHLALFKPHAQPG